jgi:ADP-ribose pyrophosphatase YjhB (NUDIX family)
MEVLKIGMEKYSRHSHSCVWINCISCLVPHYSRSSRIGRGAINLQDLKTLWKGIVPIREVRWTYSSDCEHVLSRELEAHKNKIWTDTLNKYPDTYDGKILILDNFQINEGVVEFMLSFMRFSRILVLVKTGQPAPGYGTLGFQSIIFSLDKKHVLAGTRSERSQYCPLFHSVPGGMLETRDLEGDFESACMREIEEETDVKLAPEKYLVALVSELHGTVGVVAVISALVSQNYDIKERVSGNKEWKNQELSWYSVDRLNNCLQENSLEGLLFVKQERSAFRKTNSSALWS